MATIRVAQLDLLLDEVLQQVAAHRALGVGAEALALAGHDGGDEVQRVDLRVRVRQRGAGLAALVDDDVHVGRAVLGVRAHPLAPHVERVDDLADLEVGERGDRVRGVDDDLVRAARRRDGEQVGLGEGLRRRAARVERRIEVGHDAHAPARGVRRTAVGAQRVGLRRRAVLVTLEEGILLGVDRVGRRGGQAAARPRGAVGSDDRPVAGERIDADFGHGPGRVDARASNVGPAPSRAAAPRL